MFAPTRRLLFGMLVVFMTRLYGNTINVCPVGIIHGDSRTLQVLKNNTTCADVTKVFNQSELYTLADVFKNRELKYMSIFTFKNSTHSTKYLTIGKLFGNPYSWSLGCQTVSCIDEYHKADITHNLEYHGSVSYFICVKNVSCNFEEDSCFFQQPDRQSFPVRWARGTGRVHNKNSYSGYYMYVKTSDQNQLAHDYARLISPPVAPDNRTRHCLTFSYFQNGGGYIRVVQVNVTSHLRESVRIFEKNSEFSSFWQTEEVEITVSCSYQLYFEAKTEAGQTSIDNIEVQRRSCQNTDSDLILKRQGSQDNERKSSATGSSITTTGDKDDEEIEKHRRSAFKWLIACALLVLVFFICPLFKKLYDKLKRLFRKPTNVDDESTHASDVNMDPPSIVVTESAGASSKPKSILKSPESQRSNHGSQVSIHDSESSGFKENEGGKNGNGRDSQSSEPINSQTSQPTKRSSISMGAPSKDGSMSIGSSKNIRVRPSMFS